MTPPLQVIDLGLGTIRLEADGEDLAAYGPPGGLPSLRHRLAELHDCSPLEVTITAGASMGLVSALAVLPDQAPVLIPNIHYPAYRSIAASQCRQTLTYTPDELADPERLRDRLASGGTILITTPHNPTGAVLDERSIDVLAETFAPTHSVIVDRAYAGLDHSRPGDDGLRPVRPNTIAIYSLSKRYQLAGARIGYAIAKSEPLAKLEAWHWRLAMTTSVASQWLALEALKRCDDDRRDLLARLTSRRDLAVEFARTSGLRCTTPTGGLFLWCSLPTNSTLDGAGLLAACGVSGVPGPAFGGSSHEFRLSFAVPETELRAAFERIALAQTNTLARLAAAEHAAIGAL